MEYYNTGKLGDKAGIKNRENLSNLMVIFGIIMVILIIISGFFILVSPSLSYWPKNARTIFALIIFAYGFYRSMNIFYKFKNKEDNQ